MGVLWITMPEPLSSLEQCTIYDGTLLENPNLLLTSLDRVVKSDSVVCLGANTDARGYYLGRLYCTIDHVP